MLKKLLNFVAPAIILLNLGMGLPIPASAAHLVPGTMPKQVPLQPLPAGIQANTTQNINSSPQSETFQLDSNGSADSVSAPNTNVAQDGVAFENSQQALAKKTTHYLTTLIIAFSALLLILLAFLFYKKVTGQSEE